MAIFQIVYQYTSNSYPSLNKTPNSQWIEANICKKPGCLSFNTWLLLQVVPSSNSTSRTPSLDWVEGNTNPILAHHGAGI